LIGASLFSLLLFCSRMSVATSALIAIGCCFVFRMLAIAFNWNIPDLTGQIAVGWSVRVSRRGPSAIDSQSEPRFAQNLSTAAFLRLT
jgi:hypothetical protein